MNDVVIHMKLDALTHLQSLGLNYQERDGELCEHYGINYDLVNCIEAR